MSDSSSDHHTAFSSGIHGASNHSNDEILPQLESPAISPGSPGMSKGDAGLAEAALAPPAAARDDCDHDPQPIGAAEAFPRGTMLILAPQRTKAEAPNAEPAPDTSSSRIRLSPSTAMMAAVAAVGGLAGSLATAGISHLTQPQSAAPSYYAPLAEALGRVDRELTTLKSAAESTTNATNQQVVKIAERMDRVEKAQSEAGARSAKTPDLNVRMERRIAAVSSDITGTVAEPRAAMPAARPIATDARPPSPAPTVDGWVVRDVYNGSALIQGRAGIIHVVPGDNLRGLGRIKQVRRQDGKWVVVTSRGQIVSR